MALTSQTKPAGLTNTAKLPANYSSSQNISYHRNNIRSSASPSLSYIVEDVQLQGTLNCQRNHRTQLIRSTTIHPDACTRLSPGWTSPFTSTHHPRFWQLHAAKHQSRNCTCTSLHKTQLQLTASSSYSLAHRRGSIRHCQGTSSRPATEPRNARHQLCITIVAPSNPTQPTHRPTLNHIIHSNQLQHQLQSS